MQQLGSLLRVLGVVVSYVALPALATSGPRPPAEYRPGEILVVLEADAEIDARSHALRESRHAVLSDALVRHGIDHVRTLGGVSPSHPTGRFLRLSSTLPDFDPQRVASELRASGLVRAAIPNYQLKLCITIPNDPYVLPEQWYIHSTSDADIDLPEAWDVERGDSSVVIGIADTGVDLGHPDLIGKIWTNPDEIPGNLVDDDANGYVDDVQGWDFGNDDNDPNPHPVFDPTSGIDVAFHGTFVAGIASASTNNSTGMAGAGWHSRLMPLKVVDQDGLIYTSALAEAFLYAAREGADILNLSLGQYGEPGLPEFFQQLVDHADSARVVCVAGAGNDADSARFYPAANDKVIAVGATDQSNYRTTFSNWGPWIDVAAPGTGMLSAINRNYTIDEFSEVFYLYLFGWDGKNPYMYGDGTSFACPLVAGTAALVRSNWPGLRARAMEAHMIGTGDVRAYDLPIGVKVNAFKAVMIAVDVPTGPEAAPTASLAPAWPNPFRDRMSIRFALEAETEAAVRVFDAQGRAVRTLMMKGRRPAGVHRVEWDGRADDGRLVKSGVYFVNLETGTRSATRRVAFLK